MKHLNEKEQVIHGVLARARTIAVVGASPRGGRHSSSVCGYLRRAGFEVIPIRPDRAEVAGLPSWASLADLPRGAIDVVVIFRRSDAVEPHLYEAAERKPLAVWLPPGVATPRLDAVAAALRIKLIKDACIEEAHRHVARRGGHPEAMPESRAR
jgi:predicted CoA-binding protein